MTDDAHNVPTGLELSRGQLLGMTLGVEGGMLVVGAALAYFLGVRFWEGMSVSASSLGWGVLSAIPMLLGAIGIFYSNSKMGVQLRNDFDLVILMFRKARVVDLVFVSIMAGLCEEVLFRGFGQNVIVGYIGVWPGLVVASLIFGVFHFVSFSYFVFATLIGVYLGGVYVWTGDLVIPIVGHAVYDFIALAYGVREGRRRDSEGQSSPIN